MCFVPQNSKLPYIGDSEVYQEWINAVCRTGMNLTLVKSRERISWLLGLSAEEVEEVMGGIQN